MRAHASHTCGQGLAGQIWARQKIDWFHLQQLKDDPEQPTDALVIFGANLVSAVVGVPIRDLRRAKEVVGVLILYLPLQHDTSGAKMPNKRQHAFASSYLEPRRNPTLHDFLTRGADMISITCMYQNMHNRFLTSTSVFGSHERNVRRKSRAMWRRVRVLVRTGWFPAQNLRMLVHASATDTSTTTASQAHCSSSPRHLNSVMEDGLIGGQKEEGVQDVGGGGGADAAGGQDKDRIESWISCKGVYMWFAAYFEKFNGQGGKQPAGQAWRAGVCCFIGCFSSLLAISYLSVLTGNENGNGSSHVLLLGSFGALATLLYGAPNSPFGQPRMILGGESVVEWI